MVGNSGKLAAVQSSTAGKVSGYTKVVLGYTVECEASHHSDIGMREILFPIFCLDPIGSISRHSSLYFILYRVTLLTLLSTMSK